MLLPDEVLQRPRPHSLRQRSRTHSAFCSSSDRRSIKQTHHISGSCSCLFGSHPRGDLLLRLLLFVFRRHLEMSKGPVFRFVLSSSSAGSPHTATNSQPQPHSS